MDDFESWLEELEGRTVQNDSNRESDLEKLRSTNPGDDLDRVKSALESQYARRAAPPSGIDSSEYTRRGYGSARSETADDAPRAAAPRQSVAQSWLSGGGSGGGSGSGGYSNQDPRASALYDMLMGRATQSLSPDRNDPVIRAQADAFGAQTERARRNYLSDTAEREGPYANMQGERRMAAERQGQLVGGFEAQLMGREVEARRDEIRQALIQMQGMLTADQEAALRMELANLDAELRREGMGYQNDQFMRDLALREWDLTQGYDFRLAGL